MTDYGSVGPLKKAPKKVCPECPWRVSLTGQDRGYVDPTTGEAAYGPEHQAAVWRNARKGNISICHLTVGDRDRFRFGGDPAWLTAGFLRVSDHAQQRECAGSVVALLREMRLVVDAGSYVEYRRRRGPAALTAETVRLWLARLTGNGDPLASVLPPLSEPDIGDDDVLDGPAIAGRFMDYASEAEVRSLLDSLSHVMGGDS